MKNHTVILILIPIRQMTYMIFPKMKSTDLFQTVHAEKNPKTPNPKF